MVVPGGLFEDAGGKGLRRFGECFGIERRQRLKRRVRDVAPDDRNIRVRTVERHQVRMRSGALEERVEAATVTVGSAAGRPLEIVCVTERGDVLRHRRERTRAADPRRKQTAGGEMEIPHDFGLDAQAVLAVEEFVLRIHLRNLGTVLRSLPVGCRVHDEPYKRLVAPAPRDKLISQPV